jgi:membrane protein involved in colicin uptake
MDIYISKGEERKGPYSEDSIRQFLADGQFDGTELAWHEGLTQWIAVEEVGREAESAAQEQADLDRQNEEHLALCVREVDEAKAKAAADVKAFTDDIAAAEAKAKVAMEVAVLQLNEATASAECTWVRKTKTVEFKYEQDLLWLEQEKIEGLEVADTEYKAAVANAKAKYEMDSAKAKAEYEAALAIG